MFNGIRSDDLKEGVKNAEIGQKYDCGKPRYSLIPSHALEEVVKVLTFGSEKYGDFNWINVANAEDRYFSAAQRHIWQWKRGEINDQESNLHHLASAISNLMFILEMEKQKMKSA